MIKGCKSTSLLGIETDQPDIFLAGRSAKSLIHSHFPLGGRRPLRPASSSSLLVGFRPRLLSRSPEHDPERPKDELDVEAEVPLVHVPDVELHPFVE